MKLKMSIIIIFIIFSMLATGCSNESNESIKYKKVIPDSLKIIAGEKVKEILSTIKVESRVDDEDMEDWIREAKRTVIDLYGVPTVGIEYSSSWGVFIPYDKCSLEQKRMIDKYLTKKR